MIRLFYVCKLLHQDIHSRFALIVHLAQNSFSVYVSVPHPYSTDCSSLPCWVSPAVRHIGDSTRHFREHQSRRIACAADVTPCLAADKETEVQPFLRDDGVQFVHVCRTDPFGIGKVCNLFIGRSVVTAAILSRTYRIVIVIRVMDWLTAVLNSSSAFAISCATPYPMA